MSLDETSSAPPPQNFIALDLELNQPSQTIIQVGIAIGNHAQSSVDYTVKKWYLSTDESISEPIVRLTGITDEDIARHGVEHQQCADELASVIDEHAVFHSPVTWGAGDAHDLRSCFEQRKIPFNRFGHRWIDVKTIAGYLAMARPHGREPLKGGLRTTMKRHGCVFEGKPHRADVDALNTLKLFFHLVARQRTLEAR